VTNTENLAPGRVVVTAQHAALAGLRDRIMSGALRPGDQVRQEAVAIECGLSVPPIREALRMLEAEGQVDYIPNRGYFVAQLNSTELAETYRLRELLETEAITIGVPKLGPREHEKLQSLLDEIERFGQLGDIGSLTIANKNFHFAIFHGSNFARLENFIRMLWESTDPYRSIYFANERHRAIVNEEHRAILKATIDGDIKAVVELSRRHRDNACQALQRLLDVDSPALTESNKLVTSK
jgi:DNA-binding GntR family transcriptional regulator